MKHTKKSSATIVSHDSSLLSELGLNNDNNQQSNNTNTESSKNTTTKTNNNNTKSKLKEKLLNKIQKNNNTKDNNLFKIVPFDNKIKKELKKKMNKNISIELLLPSLTNNNNSTIKQENEEENEKEMNEEMNDNNEEMEEEEMNTKIVNNNTKNSINTKNREMLTTINDEENDENDEEDLDDYLIKYSQHLLEQQLDDDDTTNYSNIKTNNEFNTIAKNSTFYSQQLELNSKNQQEANPIGYFFTSLCKYSNNSNNTTSINSNNLNENNNETYNLYNPFGKTLRNLYKNKILNKSKLSNNHTDKNRMLGWTCQSNEKWMKFNYEKEMACRCKQCDLNRFEKLNKKYEFKNIILIDLDNIGILPFCKTIDNTTNNGNTNNGNLESLLKLNFGWFFYNGFMDIKQSNEYKIFDCFNFIIDEDVYNKNKIIKDDYNEDDNEEERENDLKKNEWIESYLKEKKEIYGNTIFGILYKYGHLMMSQTNLQKQSADIALLSILEYLINKNYHLCYNIKIFTRDIELQNSAKKLFNGVKIITKDFEKHL
ncbi:hypothetical protein ABK040_009039 [Willaertia magna]